MCQSHWRQVCDLAPIFNELVDRVSLDGKFLQDALSRTKKGDEFTSRLLDIHSKMLELNKKEDNIFSTMDVSCCCGSRKLYSASSSSSSSMEEYISRYVAPQISMES
ncbi:hypothetical protein K1719_018235 [Acacia pycnantha]|nr:hypothetical protein K1719_018235 [Acacia pycnantha]